MLPIPSRTPREAEWEEGCSTRRLLHQPQWEGQDHPEDAGPPPARRHQPTREAPASAALPRTHLDAPPGKFRVLLLKRRDELIIVHLQTHARHALPGAASGQGAGRPARVNMEPLALAGAPCQRPQSIQHSHRWAQMGGRRRSLSSGSYSVTQDKQIYLPASLSSSVKWDSAPCPGLICRVDTAPRWSQESMLEAEPGPRPELTAQLQLRMPGDGKISQAKTSSETRVSKPAGSSGFFLKGRARMGSLWKPSAHILLAMCPHTQKLPGKCDPWGATLTIEGRHSVLSEPTSNHVPGPP